MGLLNFFKKGDGKEPQNSSSTQTNKAPAAKTEKHTSNPDIHLEKPPEPAASGRTRKHLPNVPQLGITPIPELSTPIVPEPAQASTAAPVPSPVTEASTSSTPQPPPSLQSVTPGNKPSMMTQANEPSIVNNMLRIPTPILLSALPDNCKNPQWQDNLANSPAFIEFSQHDVLPILRQGAFRVTAGPLAGMLSEDLVSSYALTSQEIVELPLKDFLSVIPKEWFITPNQSLHLDEVLKATIDPFEITSLSPAPSSEAPSAPEATPEAAPVEPKQAEATPNILPQTASSENTKTQEMPLPQTPEFLTATLPGQNNLTDPLTKTLPALDTAEEEVNIEVLETIAASKEELTQKLPEENIETMVAPRKDLDATSQLTKTPLRDNTNLDMLKGMDLPNKASSISTPIDTQETMVAPASDIKKSSLDTDSEPITILDDSMVIQPFFILKQLPRELAAASQKNLNQPLNLDKFQVLDFLKSGRFLIPFRTLSCYLAPPPGTVKLEHLDIPLQTVLPHIPLAWFDLGNQSTLNDEVLLNIHDVFELPEIEALTKGQTQEDAKEEVEVVSTKPEVEPAPVTAAEEVNTPAPAEASASLSGLDLISGSSPILNYSTTETDLDETDEEMVTPVLEEPEASPIAQVESKPAENTAIPIIEESADIFTPIVEEEELAAPVVHDEEELAAPVVHDEEELAAPAVHEEQELVTPLTVDEEVTPSTPEEKATHRPPPKPEAALQTEFDLDRNLFLEGKDKPLEPGILDTQCLTRRTVHDLSKTAFEFVDTPEEQTSAPKPPSVAQPTSAEKTEPVSAFSTAPPVAPSKAKTAEEPASTTPSIAPNGIQLNTCNKKDLLLINGCTEELADKVLFNRGDGYKSLNDLKDLELINSNEFTTLTGLDQNETLASKETAFFEFANEPADSALNKMTKALLKKCSLHSLILSSLDGIEICNCGDTSFLNSTPEKLAAAIPGLLTSQKSFTEHSQLPTPTAFTFYIEGHAVSVAQAGEMYFTAIHAEKHPSAEHIQLVETAQTMTAWYCSSRLVL